MEIPLPEQVSVSRVLGSELAAWSAKPGALSVTLQPGERSQTSLAISFTQPSLAGAAEAVALLSAPLPVSAGRTTGTFTIKAGDGAALREITAPAGVTEHAGEWTFSGHPAPIKVKLQRLRPRFSADLDTVVDFQEDAVYLTRTVTLHEQEGRLFALVLTIPAGEEVLEVKTAAGAVPDWRVEGQRLIVRWTGQEQTAAEVAFVLRTRTEPAGWAAAALGGADAKPLVFPVTDARIEGAEHVTGYLALQAGGELSPRSRSGRNAGAARRPHHSRARRLRMVSAR